MFCCSRYGLHRSQQRLQPPLDSALPFEIDNVRQPSALKPTSWFRPTFRVLAACLVFTLIDGETSVSAAPGTVSQAPTSTLPHSCCCGTVCAGDCCCLPMAPPPRSATRQAIGMEVDPASNRATSSLAFRSPTEEEPEPRPFAPCVRSVPCGGGDPGSPPWFSTARDRLLASPCSFAKLFDDREGSPWQIDPSRLHAALPDDPPKKPPRTLHSKVG